jgi:hypothetical protein
MPQTVQKSKSVSLATQRMTDELFYAVADGFGGVIMVPRPAMRRVLDRYEQVSFRDAEGSTSPTPKPKSAPGTALAKATGALKEAAEGGRGVVEGVNAIQKWGENLRSNDQEERRPPNPQFAPSLTDNDGRRAHADDQEEPAEAETGLGQIIASLEDPGPGMTYRLERQPDGSIAIVVCEDDGADLNQNDAAYRHKLTSDAKFFNRLNGIHRRKWARSRTTKDWSSTQPSTLYRHKALAPGERLELQGPDAFGGYDLVLFNRTSPDLLGPVPPASGSKATSNPGTMGGSQTWAAQPGSRSGELSIHEIQEPVRTGDRAPVMTLAKLNQIHRAHWRRSA